MLNLKLNPIELTEEENHYLVYFIDRLLHVIDCIRYPLDESKKQAEYDKKVFLNIKNKLENITYSSVNGK